METVLFMNSVFDINTVETIHQISLWAPLGIHLNPQDTYQLGANNLSPSHGLKLTWPKDCPEDVKKPIPESFICIVTGEPVDLRDFSLQRHGERRKPSQLEKFAYLTDTLA